MAVSKTAAMIAAYNKLAKTAAPTRGMYGRIIKVTINNKLILQLSQNYDIQFDIPFDNGAAVNTSTIYFYNLSEDTLSQIVKGAPIKVEAGYELDSTGEILNGKIKKVETSWSDLDKVTKVTALDSSGTAEMELENFSYSKGTSAQKILKDLIKYLGIPIKVWKPKKDYVFKNDVSVSGTLQDAIKTYAEVCYSQVYVCKSQVYVVGLGQTASKEYFQLDDDHGLLSVSTYEEDDPAYNTIQSDKTSSSSSSKKSSKKTKVRTVKAKDDTKPQVRGVNIKMLLQHRIYTGAIIRLKSRSVNGTFKVIEGSHNADDNDFTTTVKAQEM